MVWTTWAAPSPYHLLIERPHTLLRLQGLGRGHQALPGEVALGRLQPLDSLLILLMRVGHVIKLASGHVTRPASSFELPLDLLLLHRTLMRNLYLEVADGTHVPGSAYSVPALCFDCASLSSAVLCPPDLWQLWGGRLL